METAIRTQNLIRRFGRKNVIYGLNMEVPKGSVFGFLGKNGAGKSTTIRMLMGLLRRHGGKINVLGLDPKKDEVEIKKQVGYVPENSAFYEWLTVEQTMGLFANYNPGWNDFLADSLLKEYQLDLKAKVGNLSKGNKAKLALLCALAPDPDLLILDEPTTGLDPAARRDFTESVLKALPEKGKTVFISSHLINEISGFVDYVGILKNGQLLLNEKTEDLIARIKLVRLLFPDGNLPQISDEEGFVRVRQSGERELIVTVDHFGGEQSLEVFEKYSPAEVKVESLGLEDIFIELLPKEGDI